MAAKSAQARPQGDVIATLQARGLVSQMTESGLQEAATQGYLTVYCGFDPSRPSLQIGNLVPVIVLAHFQRLGHRPILVVGGGTGMIGDPGGKSTERVLLTAEQVAANAERVRQQLAGYLAFDGPNAAVMVNNLDWLGQITLIDYLRDVGKHFSVNAMMAKDSVRSRFENAEQGISYTEFSYMILQAIDYLHLYDALGCAVQVGGNDQWGNLTAGVDLIRRTREAHVHALTAPLITSATGAKLGKSEQGALYLDPELTSPYDLYQYWINTDDRDVGHYLRVFTFLPLDEIADLERQQAANPSSRVAQRTLAHEITRLVHGEAVARGVAGASDVLFGAGIGALTPDSLPYLASVVPTTTVATAALAATINNSNLAAAIISRVSPISPETLVSLMGRMPPISSKALASLVQVSKVPPITGAALASLIHMSKIPSISPETLVSLMGRMPPISSKALASLSAQASVPANATSEVVATDLTSAARAINPALVESITSAAQTGIVVDTDKQLTDDDATQPLNIEGSVLVATIAKATLTAGLPILDALVALGVQPSRGAARRLIQQGGLYVNEQRWRDPDRALTDADVVADRAIVIRMGKNKYQLLLVD